MKRLFTLTACLVFLSASAIGDEYDFLDQGTSLETEGREQQITSVSKPKKAMGNFDLVAFYPKADAWSLSPPQLSNLSILCRGKESGRHVTFVGDQEDKVRLIMFTNKRAKNLENTILLERHFTRPKRRGDFPSPTALPSAEGTLDWAYIYDRNRDGKVDYYVYLHGALSVKPEDFRPSDYPVHQTGKTEIKITGKQYVFAMDNSRLVFNHFADDNFDGATDGVVAPIFDDLRPIWVDRFGVLRSKRFDKNIDESWTFKSSIDNRNGVVKMKDQKFILEGTPYGERFRSGEEWLDHGTSFFEIINKHAKRCGFTSGSFL